MRRGDCLTQADLIDIVDRQRGVGHDLLTDEEQHPDRVRRGGQWDERLTNRGQQERRDHNGADPETGQAAGDHRAEKRAHSTNREDHPEDAGIEADLLVDVKQKYRSEESEGQIQGQVGDDHPAQDRLPPDRM